MRGTERERQEKDKNKKEWGVKEKKERLKKEEDKVKERSEKEEKKECGGVRPWLQVAAGVLAGSPHPPTANLHHLVHFQCNVHKLYNVCICTALHCS